MKSFIRKIAFFIGVPILLSLPFSIWKFDKLKKNINSDKIKNVYSNHRLDSIREVPNKIIIIGGSNLLFGIDKYLLEKEIKRPVFTLAYVRTVGIENMLLIAKKVYRDGDLVLISIEYGSTSKGSSGELLDYYLSNNSVELFEYFFKYYLWEKKYKNPNYSEKEEKCRSSIYQSFNHDLYLTKLRNQNYRMQETYLNQGINLTYSKDDIEIIKKFIKENKFELLGVHPPLCIQKLDKSNIKNIEKNYFDSLPIRYITKQKNFLFDTAYIFDYSYHLNQKGRELRTSKLSIDLRNFFIPNQIIKVSN